MIHVNLCYIAHDDTTCSSGDMGAVSSSDIDRARELEAQEEVSVLQRRVRAI